MKNIKLLLLIVALSLVFSSCGSQARPETKPVSTVNTVNTVNNVTTSTAQTSTLSTKNALCSEPTTSTKLPAGDVLNLAKTKEAEAYSFVEKNGGEIISVDNGKGYVVWWQPSDFDAANDTVLVSLHGHGEFAVKDFEVWYPTIKERNYAFVGVQWWFGRTLESNGYYSDVQIYKNIKDVLTAKGIPSNHVIFQGFSMGAARSYGITMYDHLCGNKYFSVSIANSGPWEDDYPLYTKVLAGDYGEKPLDGTRWILFCGDKDDNENGLGHVCDGMELTKERLTQFGGIVSLFIKDPVGDHGSFMMNSANSKKALDEAEVVYKEVQ